MSDETNGKGKGGGDGKGTDAPRPSLSVRAQYVKDLSFENPSAPGSITAGDAPTINISVQVEGRQLDDGAHEVELRINAEAKRGDTVVFLTELDYAGVFVIANVPPEHIQSVVMVECPRLLFPFARRVIADCTRDGGFPPLMLEPIDFLQLFLQSRAQQSQATDTAATPPLAN